MAKKSFWAYGEKAALARAVGIADANLHNILSGKKGVSYKRAVELEKLCMKLFGKKVPRIKWLENSTTKHRAFN